MGNESELKLLESIELEQRKKTEESYRSYRNAGIAISTIFLSFVTGVAYQVVTSSVFDHSLKALIVILTAVSILGVFSYQVALYGGFRYVALAHYYFLRSLVQRFSAAEADEIKKSLSASGGYSSDSNRWFGLADRVFIGVCGTVLGHMLVSGMIYFRAGTLASMVIVFCLPLVAAFCISLQLRT